MTAETSDWARRTVAAIVEDRAAGRAEALWPTVGPNGVDLLIGEGLADLGAVRGILAITTPAEWACVADLIESLMEREPLSKSPRYSGERIILGTLAAELRGYAVAAERSRDA